MRPIRSFVLREGRLTDGQRRALEELWPRYGVDAEQPIDPPALFGREAPVWLEIGFGNGEALRHMAGQHPEVDFLGIEVHRPGVGRLMNALAEDGLTNVRVLRTDAAEVVRERIPDGALDRVLVFFPDPWPKKRHHKRRLIQPAFLDALARVPGRSTASRDGLARLRGAHARGRRRSPGVRAHGGGRAPATRVPSGHPLRGTRRAQGPSRA